MQRPHIQASVLGIFLSIFLAVSVQSETHVRLEAFRSKWVGQYPHKEGTFFLNEPKIRKITQLVLNKKQIDALASGSYLESPIDYVAGYYVLSFAANLRLMEEGGWVYVIVREHTGSMHAAIKDSNNRVEWKHSAESDLPPQILKMLDLWGKK